MCKIINNNELIPCCFSGNSAKHNCRLRDHECLWRHYSSKNNKKKKEKNEMKRKRDKIEKNINEKNEKNE